jgi:hypothetical protein
MMKKVLVVDDNVNNLKNATQGMKEMGYETLSAPSAAEAIRIIHDVSRTEDIFMVLSDMNMEHEESGMEVVDACGDFCIPCIIVTGGGFDHGRPAIRFLGPLSYPVFLDKGNDKTMLIGSFTSEEKTSEVWTEAAQSFLSYWDRIGESSGLVDFVEFVFEIRKDYRKQKGIVITRNEQFSFQSNIVPEMTEEYYKARRYEEEKKKKAEEREKIVAGRKQKDFYGAKDLKMIEEKCQICGGNLYEYSYNS